MRQISGSRYRRVWTPEKGKLVTTFSPRRTVDRGKAIRDDKSCPIDLADCVAEPESVDTGARTHGYLCRYDVVVAE